MRTLRVRVVRLHGGDEIPERFPRTPAPASASPRRTEFNVSHAAIVLDEAHDHVAITLDANTQPASRAHVFQPLNNLAHV